MSVVNIFGVQRSGTTGLELYVAYLLAKREGAVWINSEPYIWVTRKGPISYYGQAIYEQTGFYLDRHECLTPAHQAYLRGLVSHDTSVVTKFVRGCGFIGQINEIMRPDLTFIIIRDIYSVLTSLRKFKWDFFSVHRKYKHKSYWPYFVSRLRRHGAFNGFPFKESDLDTDARRNAFYWYIMNKKALNYTGANSYVIWYDNIREVEGILKRTLGLTNAPHITDTLFTGDKLNKDNPLRDVNGPYFVKFVHLLDSLAHFLNGRLVNVFPYLNRRIGSKAVVMEKTALTGTTHAPSNRSEQKDQQTDPLIEYLRNHLMRDLFGSS